MYNFEQKKEACVELWRDIVDFYDDKNTLSWNKAHAIENMCKRDTKTYNIINSMLCKCIFCDMFVVLCRCCPLYVQLDYNKRCCVYLKSGAGVKEAEFILYTIRHLHDLPVNRIKKLCMLVVNLLKQIYFRINQRKEICWYKKSIDTNKQGT